MTMKEEFKKALELAYSRACTKQEKVDKLVKEVLSLNQNSTEIGAGKLANLIQLAKEVEKECR